MTSTLVQSLKSATGEKGSAPDVRVALVRLSGDLKQRTSQGSSSSSDFFSDVLSALSTIAGTANADLRLNCLFECASFFYNGGYPSRATRAAELLKSLATRVNSDFWCAKAFNLAGLLSADTGDVASALANHVEALEGWRRLSDIEGEIASLNNIGVALNYAGLYRDAVPCFERVARIAGTLELRDLYVGRALCNLAQSHLYLEELGPARSAIDSSLRLALKPNDYEAALNRAIREFTAFSIAIEERDLRAARRHAEECVRYGRWGENIRCRVMVLVAEGLKEIYTGPAERGMKLLEEALLVSDVAAQRIDALVALVRACDEVGRPEEALQHLTSLLDHVREVRKSSVNALFALSLDAKGSSEGLRTLEHREARLRARVAERRIVASQIEMLERLAITADVKDESSGAHGYRVGRLAADFALRLGWSGDRCYTLELAGRLHDIGKISLPDRILLKSDSLGEADRKFISAHTLVGAEILTQGTFPALEFAREVARYHHEHWDGTGYPEGIEQDRIPIQARIVALADVFDALTHGRPYSDAWDFDRAITEIDARLGRQFDPSLGAQFVAYLEELHRAHPDLDKYLGSSSQNTAFSRAREKIRLLVRGASGSHEV